MAVQQSPCVNTWYINRTGKLMKVRLVLHEDETLNRIMLEYIDGTTHLINKSDWDCLDLTRHCHYVSRRERLESDLSS